VARHDAVSRHLTPALSGQLQAFHARGRRTMNSAPDARRSTGCHRPLQRVVRPHVWFPIFLWTRIHGNTA
jgi:hypothetical protein